MSAAPEREGSAPDSGRDGGSGEHGVVHVYDGIVEQDNRLPRWWLATLFATIAFAAGYWLFFHSWDRAPLPSAAYAERKARELAAEAERIKSAGEVTPEMLAVLQRDPGTVEQGKQVFETSCVTCHDAGGKGKIGPNLTDAYWIHGGGPKDVYGIVRDGWLPKQMPAWGKQLGEARVRAVTAYVLTLRNTDAPGGKAPQGEKVP